MRSIGFGGCANLALPGRVEMRPLEVVFLRVWRGRHQVAFAHGPRFLVLTECCRIVARVVNNLFEDCNLTMA
jgi:hypothetical protein